MYVLCTNIKIDIQKKEKYMRKAEIQTDIKKIRDMAITFLYIDIAPTTVPFIATHPFTDSWYTAIPEGGSSRDLKLIDLHDEKLQLEWRIALREKIEKCSYDDIILMLNKSYLLCFLKETQNYISDADLAETLRGVWTSIENISNDINVKSNEIVSMFKRADKNILMNEEDKSVFDAFGEEVTLYRGVTSYNKKNKKALSWTLDYKKALWFATRYTSNEHEIWEITVPKKSVLCYFDSRGEKEVIINPGNLNGKIKVHKIGDENDK